MNDEHDDANFDEILDQQFIDARNGLHQYVAVVISQTPGNNELNRAAFDRLRNAVVGKAREHIDFLVRWALSAINESKE